MSHRVQHFEVRKGGCKWGAACVSRGQLGLCMDPLGEHFLGQRF